MIFTSSRFLICYLFDPVTKKLRKPQDKKSSAKEDRKLRCRFCDNLITTDTDRIPVNSSHEHTCINPVGIEYHIGCFTEAPGCTTIGLASREHTWFDGHDWQICICTHCHEHLGWLFRNGTRFFGLILNRLKSA